MWLNLVCHSRAMTSKVSVSSVSGAYDHIVITPRTGKGPFDFVSLSRKIPRNCYTGTFYFENTYTYPARNFMTDPERYSIRTEPFNVIALTPDHDREEDEQLIRKILKEMHIKPGAR